MSSAPPVPLPQLPPIAGTIGQYLLVLAVAAALGGALGVIRPVRREIVPRSAHVIQAQILLAIVGALIIIVVGESLAKAFAIVGAAGLVRYRAQIDDPKDAGVMLVALALGLTVGSGMFTLAVVAATFVIVVLWLLESIEPAARSRLELAIRSAEVEKLRPEVEHALRHRGIAYDLLDSSKNELRYEVTVPFDEKIRKLTKMIKDLNGDDEATLVHWDVRKPKIANADREDYAA